jgi:hypothetical protein
MTGVGSLSSLRRKLQTEPKLPLISAPYGSGMEPTRNDQSGRMVAARRRAALGKGALVAAAVAVFAGGMFATRSTASGHAKHSATPLTAPRRFANTVRQNALQSGAIAPPQSAPPQASTNQS